MPPAESCPKSNGTKLAYARPMSTLGGGGGGEPSGGGAGSTRDIIVLNDHESRLSPYEMGNNIKMSIVDDEIGAVAPMDEVGERTKRKYKTPTPEPFEGGLLKLVMDNNNSQQQQQPGVGLATEAVLDETEANGKKRSKNSKLQLKLFFCAKIIIIVKNYA